MDISRHVATADRTRGYTVARIAIHPGEHLAEEIEALQMSAEFWLNLQSLYELRVAEAKTGKAIKKLRTLKHLAEAGA